MFESHQPPPNRAAESFRPRGRPSKAPVELESFAALTRALGMIPVGAPGITIVAALVTALLVPFQARAHYIDIHSSRPPVETRQSMSCSAFLHAKPTLEFRLEWELAMAYETILRLQREQEGYFIPSLNRKFYDEWVAEISRSLGLRPDISFSDWVIRLEKTLEQITGQPYWQISQVELSQIPISQIPISQPSPLPQSPQSQARLSEGQIRLAKAQILRHFSRHPLWADFAHQDPHLMQTIAERLLGGHSFLRQTYSRGHHSAATNSAEASSLSTSLLASPLAPAIVDSFAIGPLSGDLATYPLSFSLGFSLRSLLAWHPQLNERGLAPKIAMQTQSRLSQAKILDRALSRADQVLALMAEAKALNIGHRSLRSLYQQLEEPNQSEDSQEIEQILLKLDALP